MKLTHYTMKRITKVFVAATVAVALMGCSTVAFTGRNQVLLYSTDQMMSLSEQEYQSYMSSASASTNTTYKSVVTEVGTNLIKGLETYVNQNNITLTAPLSSYSWSFEVVKDSSVNAFCLPNGRIVVYEGMFTVANTRDKLAIVLGHEIGHAIAQHGNERATQEAVSGTVVNMLSATLTQDQQKQAILQAALGMGSEYGVLLPYSRKHEYEADRLGLIIMSLGGYNASVAPTFWQSMSSGSSTIDFMSTHPSDEKRVANMNKYIGEAQGYATKAGVKIRTNAATTIK